MKEIDQKINMDKKFVMHDSRFQIGQEKTIEQVKQWSACIIYCLGSLLSAIGSQSQLYYGIMTISRSWSVGHWFFAEWFWSWLNNMISVYLIQKRLLYSGI